MFTKLGLSHQTCEMWTASWSSTVATIPILGPGRSEENPPADSHYCSVSFELGMGEKVVQMESLLQICYQKILCILGQFEHGFSSWFQGFQSFDFALRHACCTKWVRWDSGVWSLRFLHLFWVLGTELLQDWKVFQTQKVGWWSPYEWDLFQPTFRGLISYNYLEPQTTIYTWMFGDFQPFPI